MLFYSINMHGISPLWSDAFLCIKYGEKLHRNQWKYFLSCLLVYFSVFHININQQIGCLNNANHIHFTCTLYCAPELSIITNILREKKNLKSTKELFCYLKTMWLFSRQATMLQLCMLPVWILQWISLRCHCVIFWEGEWDGGGEKGEKNL